MQRNALDEALANTKTPETSPAASEVSVKSFCEITICSVVQAESEKEDNELENLATANVASLQSAVVAVQDMAEEAREITDFATAVVADATTDDEDAPPASQTQ